MESTPEFQDSPIDVVEIGSGDVTQLIDDDQAMAMQTWENALMWEMPTCSAKQDRQGDKVGLQVTQGINSSEAESRDHSRLWWRFFHQLVPRFPRPLNFVYQANSQIDVMNPAMVVS